MTDLLVHALREDEALATNNGWRVLVCGIAANRIEKLEDALLGIFNYECRTSDKSLVACTARNALWPEKKGDEDEK